MMQNSQFANAIRSAIAQLASDSTKLFSGVRGKCGARWFPERVVDPETGKGFTGPGAWSFISACLLDLSIPFEPVELRKPPGATAYVLKPTVNVSGTESKIYIKIEILPGTGENQIIWGRSFHYEDPR